MEENTFYIDKNDHWIFKLDGMQVTRCCFDYSVGLLLWRPASGTMPDTTVYVSIWNDFTLTTQGKTHYLRTADEGDPEALGKVISLFLKKVKSAIVNKGGRLEILFTDGARLSVDIDEKYEAWTITGPEGAGLQKGVIVGQPGGGVGFV